MAHIFVVRWNGLPKTVAEPTSSWAGHLNNVGMDLTFSGRDITLEDERGRIQTMYESHHDRMVLLPKTLQPPSRMDREAVTHPPTSTP